MRVVREEVVSLCVALGYKAAAKRNKSRMERKLQEIAELGKDAELEVEEGTEDGEKLNKLLKGIIKAKGNVEITMDGDGEEEEVEKEVKKSVKKEKEADEEEVEGEEEVAEGEETEEEEETEVKEDKTKNKKASEKAAKETKPEQKSPPKKAAKVTRHACCVKVLDSSKGKSTTIHELAEKIDAAYVKNGGKSSKVDSLYMVKSYVDVLSAFDVAKVSEDTVQFV